MSSLSTLPKGDSAWLLRKAIERIIQQISVLETNIGSSTTGNSANTQIIFNDNGVLRGDSGLTYNKTTDLLSVGAATITGALTAGGNVGFGTTNLTSVAGYNSLKINNATNGAIIDLAQGDAYKGRLVATASDFAFQTAGTIPIIMQVGGNNSYRIDTSGLFTWYDGAGGTRMTLNSTGLGVGVVPIYKFHVKDGGSEMYFRDNGIASELLINCEAGGNASLYFGDTADGIRGGITYSVADDSLQLRGYNNTERIRIDASGNVGVGVTPSAWNSSYRALQIGATGALWQSASGFTFLSDNAFVNSGASNTYITTAAASFYRQNAGVHTWWNAPSGTAGNAITFTQAMTLSAGGDLLVGTTLANASWATRLTLSSDLGTTRWAVGPYVAPQNFVISAGVSTGVYLNGTAATSWTSASDERLKDIIEPISNAVAKVGSLRAVIGKFKFDENNTRKPFLIAQDVQSVLPEAVDASNPDKLGVAYTDVIPLLVAAIKELTARVQTLEAK
jgi:hypothetical protein